MATLTGIKAFRLLATMAIATLMSACVTPKDFDTGGSIRAVKATAAELAAPQTVHFATTRCNDRLGGGGPGSAEEMNAKRCWDAALQEDEITRLAFGLSEGPGITCGTVQVNVEPLSATPEALTTIENVPLSHDCTGDLTKLRDAVLATACRCALIYVHGYNTTFAFAAKRMGQLQADLNYEGRPILFSFGAAGRLNDYINDTEAGELAAPALNQLMMALVSAGATVDVIAHSMGVRLALRAMIDSSAPKMRYVILAAPDIDPTAFLRLTEKALPHIGRLTVYTSKFDVAMSASAAYHNGRPRVGEGMTAKIAEQLSGAEIIDATQRATGPYAHSYFAESKVMIEDIRGALAGKAAQERKPLICNAAGPKSVVACTMPCPEGAKCGPSWYARFVHWLLD
ncbi:MAG: alpha/beta hydrolase [Micropepsaceae bacterium]